LARALIIGCGCRGRLLAGELHARGHVVRGTTRRPEMLGPIEAAGADAVIADPDRVSTLAPALTHVTVACLLLGSAGGTSTEVAALHGPRLAMMLLRMLDTTIRGIVYESAGSVEPQVLSAGAEMITTWCERSMIPFALLDTEPAAGHDAWLTSAVAAVERVLSGT
jgi:nucleoside-diphosphate-sugar epimerase